MRYTHSPLMCRTHSAIMHRTHSPIMRRTHFLFMFQPCGLESPLSSLLLDMYQVSDLPARVLRYDQDKYASKCTYSPLSAHTVALLFSSHSLNAHLHQSIFLTLSIHVYLFLYGRLLPEGISMARLRTCPRHPRLLKQHSRP